MVDRDKIHVLQNAVRLKCRKQIIAAIGRSFGTALSGKGSGRAVGLCRGGLEEAPGFSSDVGRLLGKRDGGAAKEKAKKLEAQGIVECPGWVSAKQRTELFEQSSILSCRRGLKDSRFLC